MKLCEVIGWFKGRRVIEFRGEFIPQLRRWTGLTWRSIDTSGTDCWYSWESMVCHCLCDSLADAESKFDMYKMHLEKMQAEKLAKKIANRITVHCVK